MRGRTPSAVASRRRAGRAVASPAALRGGERAALTGRRAAATVCPREGEGGARRTHGRPARGRRGDRDGARGRGPVVPLSGGARLAMSELALAALRRGDAATHVVEEPRERRFERFRRGFDSERYLAELRARGLRFVGRSEPGSRRCSASCTIRLPGCFCAAPPSPSCSRRRRRDRRRAGVFVVRRADRAAARSRACCCRPGRGQRARARGRRRGAPRRSRRRRRDRRRARLRRRSRLPGRSRSARTRDRRDRAGRLRVRARCGAGALALPGPQPDHRRVGAGNRDRRGARAQRRAHHRRLRAGGRAGGLRRARRDHRGSVRRDERAAAPRRDAAHGGRRRAPGPRPGAGAGAPSELGEHATTVLAALAARPPARISSAGSRGSTPRPSPRRSPTWSWQERWSRPTGSTEG